LGGHDPYSASKGAAEIIAAAMRASYFSPEAVGAHPARIATVRAGNVIGGGDWSQDRLVPDIVKGLLSDRGEVELRNPEAVRPWQHVMEPVAAYMGLAQNLFRATPGADQAWNFGPADDSAHTVQTVATALANTLGGGRVVIADNRNQPHEAHLLRLDCSKVRSAFRWQPRFNFDATISLTAEWYSGWNTGDDVVALTRKQIALHGAAH
jgi:CDP-glucose 4,6-dehydratase